MARRTHFLEPLLVEPVRAWVLSCPSRGILIATTLEPAFESAKRNRGLLGRNELPLGTALILAPCSAVHTFFMRFPIDLVFAARDGRVLKLRESVPPWRMSVARRAFAVIELAAGSVAHAGLQLGDRLVVSESAGQPESIGRAPAGSAASPA